MQPISKPQHSDIRICILSGKVDEAISLLNEHFPTVLSVDSEALPQIPSPDKLHYIPATSVNPTHLALNLHILRFIEAARTVPLPYYPPGTSQSDDNTLPDEILEQQDVQLHRAQALYSEANNLPKPDDRRLYVDELNHVCSLLVYKKPESGFTAKYMTQDRREAFADQVDSAILCTL